MNELKNQLWFAWKIVLLQYRKQLKSLRVKEPLSCDLLEKSYFCSIANNWRHDHNLINQVVICLKNRTFAVSQTTVPQSKFVVQGCDLLEKSYFCSIANNLVSTALTWVRVVICLKNRTFAVSQTTVVFKLSQLFVLWFAWKIVLLQYRKQRISYWAGSVYVVICLKNRTFAVSQTTQWFRPAIRSELWFAWKIVLLQYRKQQQR